jgi:hypothetical protein
VIATVGQGFRTTKNIAFRPGSPVALTRANKLGIDLVDVVLMAVMRYPGS